MSAETSPPKPTRRQVLELTLKECLKKHEDYERIVAERDACERNVRFTRAFGVGIFRCPVDHTSWSSHRALVTFDIKKEKVAKIWKQGCKQCHKMVAPMFPGAKAQTLCENGVQHFVRKLDNNYAERKEPRGVSTGGAHRSDLCEACANGTCINNRVDE